MSPAPEETYDAAVRRALPLVAATLTLLQAALAVAAALRLDGTDRLVVTAMAAGSAAVLGGVSALVWRRPPPDRLAPALASAVLVLVVGAAVTDLAVTGSTAPTAVVLLAVAASGAVLITMRYVVATLYLAWGLWALAALLVGWRPEWPALAAALAGASALAVLASRDRRVALDALTRAQDGERAAAVRDHLTGLANRRGLAMVGIQIVEHARRQGDAVHCLFVDVDGLKQVYDRAGHGGGDEVVMTVAEALRLVTRATDVVARWSGDEFCIVGPGPGIAPLELELRVREAAARHAPVPPDVWPVRVTAGGAMLAPWDSGTLETLLGKADQEMHLRRALRREGPSPSPSTADAE